MVDSVPEEIRFYKFKETWDYNSAEGALGPVLPGQVLRELTSLTGCELVDDAAEGKVFIGAHSEEDCKRAIGKLDNIRKYFKYSVSVPKT
jgi:hypothetical protein